MDSPSLLPGPLKVSVCVRARMRVCALVTLAGLFHAELSSQSSEDLSSLQGRPAEQPEDCSFWMFSPILVFHVKIIMGQKIFLRMWCRLNFYCTEYHVIYNVNILKKKELIFYMMHEMKCIVCYLQL